MLDLKKLVSWLSGTSQQKVEPATDNAERRQFQRLHMDDCEVTIAQSKPFPVSNLSYGGFRADLAGWQGLDALQTGTTHDCQLKLQNVQMVCRITIRNLFGTLAGCAFANFSPVQSRVVSDFIKPRILGDSLREINTAKLKNDSPELKMRWFQGDDGVQVFLWQTVEGESIKQEFYFFDYFMSWDKAGDGLQTGKIKTGNRGGFGRISPDSVAFFRIPPYRALKLGRTILECSKLPDEARDQILREIAAEEKRLFHRYIVKDGGVLFVTDKPARHELMVLNVSMNGMALYKTPEADLNCESPLNGNLIIGEKSVAAVFQPAYSHACIIGGQLLISGSESIRNFEAFLAPRLLAQYLEEVPAPPEPPPFAPPNARCYLYTGLHNTHLLSLIGAGGRLHSGRIAFMDRALRFHGNTFSEYRCPEGLIFPGDWELEASIAHPFESLEPLTMLICREMIENAEQVAPEVKKAWLDLLPGSS